MIAGIEGQQVVPHRVQDANVGQDAGEIPTPTVDQDQGRRAARGWDPPTVQLPAVPRGDVNLIEGQVILLRRDRRSFSFIAIGALDHPIEQEYKQNQNHQDPHKRHFVSF
jgi:hypothetical protein